MIFGGALSAYEFKWNANAKVRFLQTFMHNYPTDLANVVTPQNLEEFLLL